MTLTLNLADGRTCTFSNFRDYRDAIIAYLLLGREHQLAREERRFPDTGKYARGPVPNWQHRVDRDIAAAIYRT